MKDAEHGHHFKHIKVMHTPKIDLTPKVIPDFDGVLCDGDFVDDKTIIGEPVITNLGCNSIVYLRKLAKEQIPIAIFSCRNFHPNGVSLMKAWCVGKGLETEILHNIEFPTYKPRGIYIDDNDVQALKYGLYFPSIEEVKEFLNKKGK